MPSKTTPSNLNEELILPPSYQLPILIIILGIALLPLPFHPWPTVAISSFGLFLLLQSFTLRLKFTKEALVVLQLGRELRTFPFKNWLAWRLLFPKLPGLLYFREKASPHLLPILFSPDILKIQLDRRVGNLEVGKQNDANSNKKN